MFRIFALAIFCLLFGAGTLAAQTVAPTAKEKPAESAPKKINSRPPAAPTAEPFEKASVETMKTQCVRFDTEAGIIEMEVFPESAPESVRNFLNLTAVGAFETTVFSRVVPGFIVQGGNVSTRENLTAELSKRARRTIPDEPSQIRHERGILSMARSDEPNTATSHFFILVSDGAHLDGKFAAFGRVTSGIDVADKINKMPVVDEKPENPVRLKKAVVYTCPASPAATESSLN